MGMNRLNGSRTLQRPLEYIKCWINRATNRWVKARMKQMNIFIDLFLKKEMKEDEKHTLSYSLPCSSPPI